MSRRVARLLLLPELRWAGVAAVAFGLAAAAQLAGLAGWVWAPLYAVCYVAGGWAPARDGLAALRQRTLDVDLLMVLAAAGAAAIGQVLDGGLLIVIFATSGALEALATRRTEESVRSLLDLTPDRAARLSANGTETLVPAAALAVGDRIIVRPGERIGADGTVLGGASDVDQATITGEALPMVREPGDEVFAGTLNGTGTLRIRVDRDPSASVIARIVAMVEDATRTKARTQLFIERFEQRYSVGVVAATVALFAVPLMLGAELRPTLLRAMTFMIVASPCAVVLATMPPLLAAIATAGRNGVLIKSAVALERLAAVTRVALDKTGTLTQGTPRLTGIRVLPGAAVDEPALLALTAAAEHPSQHPIARAVVAAATDRGLTIPEAEAFSSTPGSGVRATVRGRTVTVGSPARLLRTGAGPAAGTGAGMEAGAGPGAGAGAEDESAGSSGMAGTAETTAAAEVAAELERDGHTAVLVMVDGVPAGVLAVADRLRPDARAAVGALARLTAAPPVLLTGDNPRAARLLAGQVGITDVRAGLLPEDKVGAVGALEAAGDRVLMVGDGVNDAPALASAHTGIAMGRAGSDLALRTADAVVVRDELATIPTVTELARRARRLVIQNLTIAGTAIVVLVTWDLTGELPLPLGVAGHEGSTMLVALNGLRLLRRTAWQSAPGPEGGRSEAETPAGRQLSRV